MLSTLLAAALMCGLLCAPASATNATYAEFFDYVTMDLEGAVTLTDFEEDFGDTDKVTILLVNPDSPITNSDADSIWGISLVSAYVWNGSEYEFAVNYGNSPVSNGGTLRDVIRQEGWTQPFVIGTCLQVIGEDDPGHYIFIAPAGWDLPGVDLSKAVPVQSERPAFSTASPTNDKLTVNGTAANPTVYKIDGSNYFKIRDVAALLNGTEKQFSVGYDNALKSVTATTGQGYTKLDTDLLGALNVGNQTATPSNDTVYINGEKAELTVYKIIGGNYFKLRDLGKALNFYVGWEKDTGMFIETDKPYSE